ncbi:MAG TPA: substrate-binding domain-containing protein [Bradyrhizobium sp.]|nr:substrate-binding domain-containing protein [Bradyrhizobium sp.]
MASAAEIKVLSSPPLRTVIEELAPRFERATNYKLVIKTGAVKDLKQQIDAGTAFDVAILTPSLINALVEDGKIAAAGLASIARSGLGVVVRAGGHCPDVDSVDAFKRALLGAKSVMYASGSAVMAHIEHTFARLGIADEIRAKSKMLAAGGYIAKAIAAGTAELGLTTIPVILETREAKFVGPFPPELQFYVDLSGGVSTGSRQPDCAQALIRHLMAAEATQVFHAKGLERTH